MDFIDKIRELARRIPQQLDHIQTEEATKSALVMPFIAALGYDVFNPAEVVPEFTADVGTKKGEKVDYAIMRDGKPILLFEVKNVGSDLDRGHSNQLYRYFTVTDGRFGVLTNGIAYRFFSDLDRPNCMDSKAFLEIDLLAIEEPLIEELKKFTKASFDEEKIVETASGLKYTREIMKLIAEQWKAPSDDFVRIFAPQVYSGRMTKATLEQFRGITRSALHAFVSDRIKNRLETALAQESEGPSASEAPPAGLPPIPAEDAGDPDIVTTEEELQAYYIVKAILREVTDASRVTMRDAKTYCAILLDDNNRKPICRLHFNGPVMRLGLFDEAKNETRVAIESLDDIYRHAGPLATTVFHYDKD
jgi:hypothetical protein